MKHLRNVAIIAHVDHGKTTLVDALLQQSGSLAAHRDSTSRMLDSGDQERERGITITAKNTAIDWQDLRLNIVDTPGHADFGGEVERILSMVDAVLLLVDASEGPMPQTRFVTRKAFDQGLRPIVVINKIDRDSARPDWVLDRTFDLFAELGASDEQLDFPVVYTSALQGYATLDPAQQTQGLGALIDLIVAHAPAPPSDLDGPLQMQISALDFSSYTGTIGIGRISRGQLRTGDRVMLAAPGEPARPGRVLQVLGFSGLQRLPVDMAGAGDIVAVSGMENLQISDTLCAPDHVEALPALAVDEPTMVMNFEVNKGPFAGRDGKFLTSRQIADRLQRELITNIALRVEQTDDPDVFRVSGRGELHLSVLIESMRREGYELCVSRPQVILRQVDGVTMEPYEIATADLPVEHQGAVMSLFGERKGELLDMALDEGGRVRLEYRLPTRGLIGIRSRFLSLTSGAGLLHHLFDGYDRVLPSDLGQRRAGVLIANGTGRTAAFALFNLQERGRLMVGPAEDVYEGMIVGEHARANDLVVNPMKAKQLTNVRAAGNDENILLTPPIRHSLEEALQFIDDDELVEVTPLAIRLRKRHLSEQQRRREQRQAS